MKSKILVLGAGGTVGRAVVGSLDRSGRASRLAFRSAAKLAKAVQSGREAVSVDLDVSGSLAPALVGVEDVFLVCAGDEHHRDAGAGRRNYCPARDDTGPGPFRELPELRGNRSMVTDNEAVLRRFYELFYNQKRFEEGGLLLAEDFANHDPLCSLDTPPHYGF